jgi:S-adenosylmethionine decarboxylase
MSAPNVPLAATHLMANLLDCAGPRALLEDAMALRAQCVALVAAAGLTVVGDYFHQFPGGGVTGTVVLAESHLAVHTWPESNYVTLDVFVCNMSCDNRAKARQLFDALVLAFLPGETRRYHLERV